MAEVFITRQPVVNRTHKIIANRFILGGSSAADAADILNDLTDVWPGGDNSVFVSLPHAEHLTGIADWVAAENALLEISSLLFADELIAETRAALDGQVLGLCVDFNPSYAGKAFSAGVPFRFVAFDAGTFSPAQLKMLVAKTQPFGIPIAFNVESAQEFRAVLDSGVTATAGWFFKAPGATPAKTLNPGQAHIIRVLNLVRQGADVKQVEDALKQDVALSYKLLRYINSAGFGLAVEIQSFKHAVTLLGYEKLNRWLSLLLVTASQDPLSPALLHTALTRARFMESLATGLVDKAELDNLFIAGAFSLLDILLGVSMETALESMYLPESITDALLLHGGTYGPFLELAIASERADARNLAEQAAMLGLSASKVNRALLEALNFANRMEF